MLGASGPRHSTQESQSLLMHNCGGGQEGHEGEGKGEEMKGRERGRR